MAYNKIKKKIFFNIHNHTHYSILNSTIKINDLINKAIKYKMVAVGITDDNMMGSFDFISNINKINSNNNIIKYIIGYEIIIKDKTNNFFNYVLVAKNTEGYYNLLKISSYSKLKKLYNKEKNIYYIKKKIIKKYKKGLIFLTGNLKSEISYYIINNNIKKAKKILLYWKKIFKKDIYIEIFINNLKYENLVNKNLLLFSKKYKILYINQYDSYYLNKKDNIYHNILLCIKNKISYFDLIDNNKNYSFKLPNNNFYFKSYNNIKKQYKNYKKGFYNLNYLLNNIENIKFRKKDFLPNKFDIPNNFLKKNRNKKNINFLYLKYLTYKGAKKKYGILNEIIIKRIKKELRLIKLRNFTNYFLIVKDIIDIAKKKNIKIGPGRGSVAGSIISYSINITSIDPLKYDLLFERFLNIYRKKMPDIDLDIDYKKRQKLINYLINKYGPNKVSYIITYGKIGAKTAIRDCGRVFNMPLKNVNYLCKLIVKKLTLKEILEKVYKRNYSQNFDNIISIKRVYNIKISLDSFILTLAKNIEGIIRNIGVHACGIIMSNVDLKNYVPLMFLPNPKTNKKNILLTQFDSITIESLGLLKIDLLCLKTLTVIKDSIKKIKKNKKKFNFNLHDKATYNLFITSQTIGIFQYESNGIRVLVGKFKPDVFKDLIAFNALYRPGPIKSIPNYILRKNRKAKIIYDLPIMKKCLKDTYGITIYQEQVILLAKIISGINEYEADLLREAIAKKNRLALINLKSNFFKKSLKKGYDLQILKKIWTDWESFASYAFNKSHATCYAYLTYKTAYLKRHYNIEFWSSILNYYLQNSEKHIKLLSEAKRMGINFLLPNINISSNNFDIENKKYIRFSFTGIKGIGEKSTNTILKCRGKKKFTSILNFIYRINLRIINKRLIKILILTNSFNDFGISIYKYFIEEKNSKLPKIEYLIKEISKIKKTKECNYFDIKKKFKNFFYIDKKTEINLKTDYNRVYYNNEKIKYLGINLIRDIYYIEKKIFKIISIYEYKYNIIFDNIVYISGLIKNFYKYNKKYFIKLIDYNFFNRYIIQTFLLLDYKKYLIFLKKNKENIIVLKYDMVNFKILDMIVLKKFLYNIKKIFFIIYKSIFYNLYKIIINKIKNIINLNNKGKGINKNIVFLVYNDKNDNKKKYIYKEKILDIKINNIILYKIKKQYYKVDFNFKL